MIRIEENVDPMYCMDGIVFEAMYTVILIMQICI